ncbi:MAG TPA: prephenate dehydratase [Acidimicrobiales bacterium]|jgi:prephenate dehydratase|nr:prephenate dehydratase [Acidimicrobiales bacterium]
MTGVVAPGDTIGFLGPPGTFTEEALRSEPEFAVAELRPLRSFVHVLDAVTAGDVDFGFVAIENSIEGTVSITLDQLVFEQELIIVGEVVLPVTQNLVGPPGMALSDVKSVVSFPHATGQCRGWLAANLPDVEEVAATSTAEAVRHVGEERDGHTAAIGTALAASLYNLEVLAREIEDHKDNATRFVLVARPVKGIPLPSGHDKTSIVCFQSTDRPGSLHGILGQFSARDLNLVKLESRPTKKALGDYCFIIDFEGHVADEVVADCLRDLHAGLRSLKFLGSYPAAGAHGASMREAATEAWRAADRWIDEIRRQIKGDTFQ